MSIPDPDCVSPLAMAPGMVFLKNVVTDPRIEVGAYTYFDSGNDGPNAFERNNVLYHFPGIETPLRIGRFCALASGCLFIMDGANHAMSGFSTFPFSVFGGAWRDAYEHPPDYRDRGGTTVGDDVWIGRGAVIMPGTRIGSGSIVGAQAVVAGEFPPYSIVVGNPARVVKRRFPEETIASLLEIAWWQWPIEKVTRHIPAIVGADLERLRRAAAE